jgi:hypothetical protein
MNCPYASFTACSSAPSVSVKRSLCRRGGGGAAAADRTGRGRQQPGGCLCGRGRPGGGGGVCRHRAAGPAAAVGGGRPRVLLPAAAHAARLPAEAATGRPAAVSFCFPSMLSMSSLRGLAAMHSRSASFHIAAEQRNAALQGPQQKSARTRAAD